VSFCSTVQFACERHFVSPGHQRVVVVGEIDIATGPQLTRALHDAQAVAQHVVLDLDGTTFIDTSGTRILIAAAAHAQATTGTFEVVCPTVPVARLIGLLGANLVLEG
jgi:anti-anti-sigma factor